MTDLDYINLQNANTAKTFNFNSSEAKKQRDWSTQMSNTAHQREVNDLLKAGLNPVLSSGGTGATVTSGANASGSADTSGIDAISKIASANISASAQMFSALTSLEGIKDSNETKEKLKELELTEGDPNSFWGNLNRLILGDTKYLVGTSSNPKNTVAYKLFKWLKDTSDKHKYSSSKEYDSLNDVGRYYQHQIDFYNSSAKDLRSVNQKVARSNSKNWTKSNKYFSWKSAK